LEQTITAEEISPRGMEMLAAAVLLQAVGDRAVDFETLDLWCAILGREPKDFASKVLALSAAEDSVCPVWEIDTQDQSITSCS